MVIRREMNSGLSRYWQPSLRRVGACCLTGSTKYFISVLSFVFGLLAFEEYFPRSSFCFPLCPPPTVTPCVVGIKP